MIVMLNLQAIESMSSPNCVFWSDAKFGIILHSASAQASDPQSMLKGLSFTTYQFSWSSIHIKFKVSNSSHAIMFTFGVIPFVRLFDQDGHQDSSSPSL